MCIRDRGITLQDVAYIGDDVNCIELLSWVGLAACPSDACDKVKALPGIEVMSRKGGDACVDVYKRQLMKPIKCWLLIIIRNEMMKLKN